MEQIIQELDLKPHPEGGYYAETYRSPVTLSTKEGNRNCVTVIYFLLTSDNVSRFHRIKSDEIWFHHEGSPLTIHLLSKDRGYGKLRLGTETDKGQQPQQLVPEGLVFGATVDGPDTFSLVSCMVAPGFDFADFTLFSKDELIREFPDYPEIIRQLT